MSMINDALRRAQTGQTPATPGQPQKRSLSEIGPISMPKQDAPPVIGVNPTVPTIKLLEPIEERKSPLPMILAGVALLLVVAGGAAYWWAKNHGGFGKATAQARTPAKSGGELAGTFSATFSNPISHAEEVLTAARDRGQETEPLTKPAAAVPPKPAPAVAAGNGRESIIMERSRPTTAPAAMPASQPASATASATGANVPFPSLRLQSIYYRSNNPSVMINGRTLYVNDEVQGVTIASIQPASVTLVLSGRTNVLTLR